jgi:hypothetical protein
MLDLSPLLVDIINHSTMQLSDGNSIFELFATLYFGFSFVSGYFSNKSDTSQVNNFIDALIISFFGNTRQIVDSRNESIPRQKAEILDALADESVVLSIENRNRLKDIVDQLSLLEQKGIELKKAHNAVEVLRQKIPFFFAYACYILGLYCIIILLISALNFKSSHLSIVVLDIGVVWLLSKYVNSQLDAYRVYYKTSFAFAKLFLIVVGAIPIIYNVLFSIPMPNCLLNSWVSKLQDYFYGQSFCEIIIVFNIYLPPVFFGGLVFLCVEKIMDPFENIISDFKKRQGSH